MPADQLLWRCTTCGKWSHAKRRPSAHRRVIVLEEGSSCPEHMRADCCGPLGGCGAATPTITETRWCGPFERFVAYRDDPTPSAPSVRIGKLVEDPHDGRNAAGRSIGQMAHKATR